MLAIVIVALLLWSGQVASNLSAQSDQLFIKYRLIVQQRQMVALSESIDMFYRETNSFPTSLSALSSAAGYSHVRSLTNNWQNYAVSPAIVDSNWTFSRATVVLEDPSNSGSFATYLAGNSCGAGGFNTATSWCGTPKSMWYRKETREPLLDEIATQRARLKRLAQKFANYYNTRQKYPDVNQMSVALTANTTTSLGTLAGYGGAANACTGQFQYVGVPIDCGDMFDLWGGAIGYQYISDSHIILVSQPPIQDEAGNQFVIALDFVP